MKWGNSFINGSCNIHVMGKTLCSLDILETEDSERVRLKKTEPGEANMEQKSSIMVITTCGSKKEAQGLARLLVSQRIAACAQVSGPITSFYWWDDRLEEDEEWQVKFKMVASNFERAVSLIRKNHSYELPQIVAFKADEVLKEYADWVTAETTG